VLLAIGGGVPVAALALFMAFVSVPVPRAALLGVSLLAAHAALAVRRTRPLVSFVVVCVAFAAQTAVTGMFLVLPSTVVFPLALYSFCAYGNRRAPALGLVAGAAGAVLVTIRFVLDSSVIAAKLRPNRRLGLRRAGRQRRLPGHGAASLAASALAATGAA
jgi:hypothetical protein